MMQYFLSSIRLTILLLILFSGIYTATVWAFASAFAPNQGRGKLIQSLNKVAYFEQIGQNFKDWKYFQSRPSAVNYNAAGSGGSNKGTSNPDYLKEVQARIDTFMRYNPEIKRKDIPAELVTASGSGLDPHLSLQAALVQAPRIAKLRNKPYQEVEALIQKHLVRSWVGLAPAYINVLALNLALDQLR